MQTPEELQHAIQCHESYVKVDADNLLLRLTLGDLYHQAGRMEEAGACYYHCLRQMPGDAIARGRLASVMISSSVSKPSVNACLTGRPWRAASGPNAANGQPLPGASRCVSDR